MTKLGLKLAHPDIDIMLAALYVTHFTFIFRYGGPGMSFLFQV